MAGNALNLEAISVSFPGQDGNFQALAPLDLHVEGGRFISLIGPSGCGKSTLFNVIAGLHVPSSGKVTIGGLDATGMIGMTGYMLQKDMLLPWRTVLDNVILGLEIRGMSKPEARERVLPYLRQYGLSGFETKFPSALSGGMRQRAALLRTLLIDTDVILLDEPFGALDAQTKAQMQDWLLQIWADFRKTVIFVTHDVDEAVYLSDEICVMASRPGRIVEQIAVDLPRPRTRDLLRNVTFLDLKTRCLELLSHPAPHADSPAGFINSGDAVLQASA